MSQFTTDVCLTNLYDGDSMIYASGDNIPEVKQKLQNCIKKTSSWYRINCLKINIDKAKVMRIVSKAQLKSMSVDDFIVCYGDTPLEQVDRAKRLGLFICCDISWDYHLRLCQTTYYHISLIRRLRHIFSIYLLLQVHTATFNLAKITVSLWMAVARRKILTWFKVYIIMQHG